MPSGARYEPSSAGAGALLRSDEMRRHMADVGRQGASVAKRYSSTPGTITSTTTMSFGRWCANVSNDSVDAVRQEYGGWGKPPQAPLGHVINELRASDPNRRKGLLARLLGR